MQQPHVHTHAHATNIWFHNILAVSFVSELFVARWPLIAPLQLEHLGLLAVADATFAPMTAPLAFQDALVPLPRPLIVPEDLLRRIFTIVRERVPHSFSRGDQGPLFARTELVVHPTIQKNFPMRRRCPRRRVPRVQGTHFRRWYCAAVFRSVSFFLWRVVHQYLHES